MASGRIGLFARRLCLVSLAAVCLATASRPAAAEDQLRGVALVIGNGAYEHLPRLTNPENDARAIEDLLDSLGFDTATSTDRDGRRLARDLERFAEDARDADVAVLYYSGHGIEAGGENYLVPVDADLSALNVTDERLIPVSALIAKLKASVPVTIVMLDACRDNPFPPGAMVRVDAGAEPVPIAAGGLGETRSVVTLSKPAADAANAEQLGTVIAFAAEPGKVALDGEIGGNSPYAAAVLRHLAAMSGEEFGTVMRMVGEEVYLKTGGKQQPWINESLRRLLYFGKAAQGPGGEEGEILAERRQLLLTIAALPDLDRKQIETVAADGGVPMDALYGMLNVLGDSAPKQPEQLDAVLRAQTARLKEILAEREVLKNADPEIVRLSALADQAIADGAIASAIRIREQAKARVKGLEGSLQQAELELGSRFSEAADVYARSAATYEIAYDYRKAAADYGEAFDLIERWDDALAWKYKNAEAFALNRYGENVGDRQALEQAIAAARRALNLVSPEGSPVQWSASQDNLGYALRALGMRESDPSRLKEAVTALNAAREVHPREREPIRWARATADVAVVLRDLSILENNPAAMDEAIAASRDASEELKRGQDMREWAMAQNNLGNVLAAAARRRPNDAASLNGEAVEAYRTALQELTADRAPLAWAMVQNNLAEALYDTGKRTNSAAKLDEAQAAFLAVLDKPIRAEAPRQWAKAQAGLGNTLQALGAGGDGTAELAEAVAAYRSALEEYTRDHDPRSWALVQYNLGSTLSTLGERESGTNRFEEAAAAFRSAAEEYSRRDAVQSLVPAQYWLGSVLQAWGGRESGTMRLNEAVAAYRTALDRIASSGWRPYFAATQSAMGDVLTELARREDSLPFLEEAVSAYRAALDEYTHDGAQLEAARTHLELGLALFHLGRKTRSAAALEESRTAFSAAWEYHKSAGQAEFESYFAGLVSDTDKALAEIGR